MRNLKTMLEDLDIRYTKLIQPLLVPHPLPGRPGASFLDVPPSPTAQSGPRRSTNESRVTLGNASFFKAGELKRAPSRGRARAGSVSERSLDVDRSLCTGSDEGRTRLGSLIDGAIA